MIIAIDGPAGSGKSTISKLMAERLNIEYIDSGAIYRTLTFYGMKNFDDECSGHEQNIAEYFEKTPDKIKIVYENHTQHMWLDGEDVTRRIRDPKVTLQVKYIADNPACRELVNNMIRRVSARYSVVVDGRDIGTKVFPDTPYKFYLDAQPVIRAKRRARDLNIPSSGTEFDTLLNNIMERDKNDMEREIAPLKKAPDAFLVDTSDLSTDEVINVLLKKLQ